MADFHIRGYVRHKGPSEYVATVSAIPSTGGSPHSWDVMERTLPDTASAQEAMRKLTVELGSKLRARGETVLTVETHDL